MKLIATILAVSAAAAFAGGAHAADAKAAEALLKSSGCTACHAVDKKLVGPAYKDVAAKYRNDKKAEAELITKVKAGSKGAWGPVPMPPNAHVKDADIKTMVQWVLTVK